MSTDIDAMTAEAMTRQAQWVNRSAGQRARQVRKSFAELMPTREVLSQVAPGEIEFAGPEPDDCEPLTLWESIIFAVELFVVLLGTVALIGVAGGYIARHYLGG